MYLCNLSLECLTFYFIVLIQNNLLDLISIQRRVFALVYLLSGFRSILGMFFIFQYRLVQWMKLSCVCVKKKTATQFMVLEFIQIADQNYIIMIMKKMVHSFGFAFACMISIKICTCCVQGESSSLCCSRKFCQSLTWFFALQFPITSLSTCSFYYLPQ